MKLLVTEKYSNIINPYELNGPGFYEDLFENSFKSDESFLPNISQFENSFFIVDNKVAGVLRNGVNFVGDYDINSNVLTLKILRQINESEFEVINTKKIKPDSHAKFFMDGTEVDTTLTFVLIPD